MFGFVGLRIWGNFGDIDSLDGVPCKRETSRVEQVPYTT